MKVRELVELLEPADPDAEVLVFPQYADPSDGGPLAEVTIPEQRWTHETEICEGAAMNHLISGPGASGAAACKHHPASGYDRSRRRGTRQFSACKATELTHAP